MPISTVVNGFTFLRYQHAWYLIYFEVQVHGSQIPNNVNKVVNRCLYQHSDPVAYLARAPVPTRRPRDHGGGVSY